VIALDAHRERQARERCEAAAAWQEHNLVFCHENGAPYASDQLNWRFSKMTRRAGLGHWHAQEGRHTAVSIMSSNGVPIQEISDTVGHKSTHVTETVYRHVIVPAIRGERRSRTTSSTKTTTTTPRRHRQSLSLGLSLKSNRDPINRWG